MCSSVCTRSDELCKQEESSIILREIVQISFIMLSHVVVGHLKATSKSARQQVLEQFETIVKFSQADEPGVLRYAITIPRDTTDETTIYAIEE